MNIRCARWVVAAVVCVGLAGLGPVRPAAAQDRDDVYRSNTSRTYDGWYDSNGQWHAGTYTGDRTNGWIDVRGRFHQGSPMRSGWFDASGQWHDGTYDTSRRDGWYESTGRWHDGEYNDANGNGWYDSNGQWHASTATGTNGNGYDADGRWRGTPTTPPTSRGTGWYDSDGRWHSGTSAATPTTRGAGWYDSDGRWHSGTSAATPTNGWYDSNGRWHPGGDRTSTSWQRDTNRGGTMYRNGRRLRSNSRSVVVPEGTAIDVTINQPISTETAQVGDTWTGSVQRSVVVNSRIVIPAGTTVTGRVSDVEPASNGSRARLQLEMDGIDRYGRNVPLGASMDALTAGDTHNRNLKAIGGGALGGALLGGLLGHSKKGALIGGLLGGTAGAIYVHGHNGTEVELKAPFTVEFVTDQGMAVDY